MDERPDTAPPPRGRLALGAAGAVVAVAGLASSFGPARLTVLNAGLRLDHPPGQAIALGVMTAGLALVLAVARGRWRIGAAVLLVAGLLATAVRATDRVDVDEQRLTVRRALREGNVAWRDVVAVRSSLAALEVQGPDGTLVVATAGLRPDHRLVLERAVARRVSQVGTTAGAEGAATSPSPAPSPR